MTIKTLEDVKKYVDKDYWENGKSKNCSGYENSTIEWWWNLRLFQCWNQAFPTRHKYILDMGCALGSFVAVLTAAGGAQAYGIDLSEYAIQKGQKLFNGLRGRTSAGSIHDLSGFANNTFHYIYSNQVFEHLPEDLTINMIKEINRVLKPGGIIWAGLVLGDNGRGSEDPDLSHINIHSREWWDERFLANGFIKDEESRKKFSKTTAGPENPGYSFFKEYDWHNICYRKK